MQLGIRKVALGLVVGAVLHRFRSLAAPLALVPFDVRPSRAIWLDDTTVSSHAPPQRHICVVRRRV
jgi:hypothetical protein